MFLFFLKEAKADSNFMKNQRSFVMMLSMVERALKSALLLQKALHIF
jgi:hypothetical protein